VFGFKTHERALTQMLEKLHAWIVETGKEALVVQGDTVTRTALSASLNDPSHGTSAHVLGARYTCSS
jgi:UDP-N-acetylglucosamine 2-epimerase